VINYLAATELVTKFICKFYGFYFMPNLNLFWYPVISVELPNKIISPMSFYYIYTKQNKMMSAKRASNRILQTL
jgi:hypothetical protein